MTRPGSPQACASTAWIIPERRTARSSSSQMARRRHFEGARCVRRNFRDSGPDLEQPAPGGRGRIGADAEDDLGACRRGQRLGRVAIHVGDRAENAPLPDPLSRTHRRFEEAAAAIRDDPIARHDEEGPRTRGLAGKHPHRAEEAADRVGLEPQIRGIERLTPSRFDEERGDSCRGDDGRRVVAEDARRVAPERRNSEAPRERVGARLPDAGGRRVEHERALSEPVASRVQVHEGVRRPPDAREDRERDPLGRETLPAGEDVSHVRQVVEIGIHPLQRAEGRRVRREHGDDGAGHRRRVEAPHDVLQRAGARRTRRRARPPESRRPGPAGCPRQS